MNDQHLNLLQEIHDLRCAHEALLRIVVEAIPQAERRRILDKYESYTVEFSDEALQRLQENLSKIAAETSKPDSTPPPNEKN